MICETCKHVMQVGEFPFCPHDKQASSVIGDECDIQVQHGLCNPDGSPRRFTSKAEMAREAKRRGLVNHVEHIPGRGGDKSKHTQRWI